MIARTVRPIVFGSVAVAMVTAGASAQLGGLDLFGKDDRPEPVRASLVAAGDALVAGEWTLVGVHLATDEGWHTYWDGQNETGLETRVEWSLPDGFEAGPIRWPAPHRLVSPGDILDHVYEGDVTLLVPIWVPAEAAGSTVTISGSAHWLMCREVCIPGWGEVELTLPVVAEAGLVGPSPQAGLIKTAIARLPIESKPGMAAFTDQWRQGRLEIRAIGASRVAFYPDNNGAVIVDLLTSGQAQGDRLLLGVAAEGDRVSGVLEVWRGKDRPGRVFAVEVDRPEQP